MEPVILHKDQRLITIPSEKMEEMDKELIKLRQIVEGNTITIKVIEGKYWQTDYARLQIEIERGNRLNSGDVYEIEKILDKLERSNETGKQLNTQFHESFEQNEKSIRRLEIIKTEFIKQTDAQRLLPLWIRKLLKIA